MGFTTIKAEVTDQALQLHNLPVLASGGEAEIKIEFTFCELWDGADQKTAVFFRNKTEVYHMPLEEDDTCLAPYEPFATEGTVFVGVFADYYESGTIRTSEVQPLEIAQGAITRAAAVPNSLSLYGILEARIKALEDKAYTYGTEDLTPGVSPLATGKVHFVYE